MRTPPRITLTTSQSNQIKQIVAALDPELRDGFIDRVQAKICINNTQRFVSDELLAQIIEHVLQDLGFEP